MAEISISNNICSKDETTGSLTEMLEDCFAEFEAIEHEKIEG